MYAQIQFDLLRPWVIAATELPEVIQAYPSAPRPTTDYGLLNMISSRRMRWYEEVLLEANPAWVDFATTPDEPPEFVVTIREMEWEWSLNIYATDSLTVMDRLQPWADTWQGREMLSPLNILPIGMATRMPERVNEKWLDRSVTMLKVRGYVCEGLTAFGAENVLLGRVPSDIVEDVTFNLTTADGTTYAPLNVVKP